MGTTPESVMALMMVVFGLLTILTTLSGYIIPQIRNMEDIIPAHIGGG